MMKPFRRCEEVQTCCFGRRLGKELHLASSRKECSRTAIVTRRDARLFMRFTGNRPGANERRGSFNRVNRANWVHRYIQPGANVPRVNLTKQKTPTRSLKRRFLFNNKAGYRGPFLCRKSPESGPKSTQKYVKQRTIANSGPNSGKIDYRVDYTEN